MEARHVELKKELWVFPRRENKTGEVTDKPRVVYLTPMAIDVTRRLMRQHPSGALCRNSKGKPWTANAIRSRFRRLRRRLSDQLPSDLCTYLFRHTYVTNGLENGVDPITMAELAGHEDATMICKVYQHLAKRVDHMKSAAKQATDGQSASEPDQSYPL